MSSHPSKGTPITVLSLAGVGRSGSTLLERILGTIDGFAAVGEVVHLADRSLTARHVGGDQRCGCGEPFSECSFWQAVGARAFGGWANVDAAVISARSRRVDRHRELLRLARPRGKFRAELDEHCEYLTAIYNAVGEVSGRRIVVDSSKHPSHSYVLRHAPNVDLRVVLLVRDPRGVANSWQRVVRRPEIGANVADEDAMMPRYAPSRIAIRWDAWNLMAHALGTLGVPMIRVRYEDLVRDPQGVLADIARFAGHPTAPADLDFIETTPSGHGARLANIHSVAGNPMRFVRGLVNIAEDDAWRRELEPRQRRAVSALTAPLRWRYGYRGSA